MILKNLPDGILSITFVAALFLLTVSIRIAVEHADIRTRSNAFLYSVLLFFASFIPAQVLAEIATGEIPMARYFLRIPLASLSFYLLALFAFEVLLIRRIRDVRKKELGKNSIKESLDNLPDGLCFSKPDGTPMLVNRAMQELSYEVFGKWLINDVACARAINQNRIEPRVTILMRDPLIVESRGNVWLIRILKHDAVRETLAYDITLEWQLLREIQKKNEEIQKVNERLKKYQREVTAYTRQKEILQAKIRIHDKIGQSLIYFRHYLEKEDKTEEDRKNLIRLWTESLLILEENKEAPPLRSSWDRLLSTAKTLGVAIRVDGNLPQDEKDLEVLVGIVHEALNNAIRHGEAKNVRITLWEDEDREYCTIANDGKPATEPIHEKGGLKNIRQKLALYNGDMKISTKPEFTLTLSMPKGGEHDLSNYDR